ncbi:MAG: apolipoprotein N-acyltransferase [Deltaproteobacteria bacterium]|nr:apolipoprotein N-acyltransferase [Deltaproteobacteria bacterium]
MKIWGSILLTGILGALMYPTVLAGWHLPDLGFLGWFFLIPLIGITTGQKPRKIFSRSFAAAFFIYGISLYWMIPAMVNFGGLGMFAAVFVLLLVVVILSAFFAGAVLGAYRVQGKTGLPLFFLIPLFVTAVDFIRAHGPVGGFPWPMPAYSQGEFLSYFQWVDITGVWGLNFLILSVNVLLAQILLSLKSDRGASVNGALVLVLAGLVSLCASIFSQNNWEEEGKNFRASLLQGNVSQEIKWNSSHARDILENYLRMTAEAKREGASVALWPETAYPYTLDSYDLEGMPIGDTPLPLPVLMGAVTRYTGLSGDFFHNSALLLNQESGVEGVYHKRHLVPYGEYIPMKKWLKFAEPLTRAVGELIPGSDDEPIPLGEGLLGILICYEDIFPDLARSEALKGANILVNITNDAWYGNTSAQYQHLVFSQMRALENRRTLLRATNTGMSAVIDARGEIISRLKPFGRGIITESVQLYSNKSIYTRAGDWVAWICLSGSFVLLFMRKKRYV